MSEKVAKAKDVEVCVIFHKMGEIDTANERFSAEVVIRARWRAPSLDGQSETFNPADPNWRTGVFNPKIFVENTLGEPQEKLSYQVIFDSNGQAYMCENRSVKATFVENLELQYFPFDVQDMTVVIASERLASEVQFVDKFDEPHRVCKRSFIGEQEWNLHSHVEAERSSYSDDLANSDEERHKPLFLVKCRVARRPWFFISNMYAMSLLISVLALTTFAVSPTHPGDRLQLNFILLLIAVTFRLVNSVALPKFSYVTYLDQYNFCCLSLTIATCIWHAIVTTIQAPVNIVDVDRVLLIVFVGYFALYNIIYAAVVTIKVVNSRALMQKKNEEYAKLTNAAVGKSIN